MSAKPEVEHKLIFQLTYVNIQIPNSSTCLVRSNRLPKAGGVVPDKPFVDRQNDGVYIGGERLNAY